MGYPCFWQREVRRDASRDTYCCLRDDDMRLREDVSLIITKDLIHVFVVEALGSYLNSVYSHDIIHTMCTDSIVSQRRCCYDNDGWCQCQPYLHNARVNQININESPLEIDCPGLQFKRDDPKSIV